MKKLIIGITLAVLSVVAFGRSPHFGLGTAINGVEKNFVREGDVPCLVVMVQFADRTFATERRAIDSLLNAAVGDTTYNNAWGSARNYYIKQSGGKFRPEFDVLGPVTLAGNIADYAGYEAEMVVEALDALVGEADFAKYDVNGDGAIDNVYIIFAGGWSEEESEASIWPHNGTLSYWKRYGGKTVNRYACVSELDDGYPAGIGTFCHEFGHVLGLPDLYTLADNYPEPADAWTPTYWDLMDTGCDANVGTTPPNLSVFERYALGWAQPYELQGNETVYLRSTEAGGRGAMISDPQNPDEVFFFEYRDQSGWDTFHCGAGLLVWHVQYDDASWDNALVNNDPSNPLVRLVAADGSNGYTDYLSASYYSDDALLAGDVFPGTAGKTEFTPMTSPAFLTHSGSALTFAGGGEAALTDIGEKTLGNDKYLAFSLGAADTDATRVIVDPELASGINDVRADGHSCEVNVAGREITVTAQAGERVQVVDSLGRRIACGFTDAEGRFTVAVANPGIYLLRCGQHTVKAAID